MQRFVSAAKRLEKNTAHLNTRPIRVRGHILGETCLDFLNRKIPSKESGYWEQALLSHQIACNGQIRNSNFLLRSSDQLVHTYLEDPEPEIPTHIEIIYEDEALFVINKPAGLPVHPCGRFHFHSFTKIAKEAWPELNLHLVHRLDRETSGLLVLAKTKQASRDLTQQFEQRTVSKTYLALVSPVPTWTKLTCDMPISTQRGDQGKRSCSLDGQPATTEFKHLSGGVVEAKPFSGRTNQIRVHLAYLGHPIVGDAIYGPPSNQRLHLQACKISFRHPIRNSNASFEISTFTELEIFDPAKNPWEKIRNEIIDLENDIFSHGEVLIGQEISGRTGLPVYPLKYS
ncbi:MAG: RluA family pseudouridine synthase [Myxococcaceae bacterium]